MEWTPATLFEHFTALREVDQRAHEAEFAAVRRAVAVYEATADKWRDSANEWRGAMSDRERDFVSRRELLGVAVAFIALLGLAVSVIAVMVR